MLQRVLFRWSLHQQDQCFTKKAKKNKHLVDTQQVKVLYAAVCDG